MDAFEFLKERKRMCNSYKGCGGCPLERGNCGLNTSTSNEECERIVATVEKWSKEHPPERVLYILHAPTVDAVVVTRCKDCKHRWEDIGGLCCGYGPLVDCIVPEDFFCAYGKPKEV